MTIIYIVLGFAVIVFMYMMTSYNSFIRLKNLVKEAWSGIDVQLKRRFDLIPNLIETVKGYAAHEKGTFEEVARLRNLAGGAATVAQSLYSHTTKVTVQNSSFLAEVDRISNGLMFTLVV